ncbi:cell wall hydrolase [Sphingomonas sp. Leaf22]|uniref:cell wall hydrolase n=1 Tax=Sphingomonas sp. Leaf22 TaxID=1735687 RepID=UPI0006FA3626|nr:cell wall hydrolase [Sphingomonas sp. Leaf22]KQM88934.1 cell wall hydrolase [Sphingomonas sp. Leaf22]
MATFSTLVRNRWIAIGIALIFAGTVLATFHPREPQPAPPPARSGYEADDHFPGAALLLLDAPVGRGETGTTALPPLPVPNDTTDTSIRAARPFALRGSQIDRARALQCLTSAIYYEAGNEPDAGQRAVAQVVLNRVRHPASPATVCGVVFQGSDHPRCQFSFACDGAMARTPAPAVWLRARRVAARALAGEVFAPVGLATHYHTYAVTPSWNRTLVMTGVFGAHFFHRWKGGWGTPAAFRDRYVGGEPLPGPPQAVPLPATTVPMATVPPPIAALPLPVPVSTATPAPVTLPADSQILDRWKDSGRPLR